MSHIPQEILQNIDQVIYQVRQNGPDFLNHLMMTNRHIPQMNFLFPESPFYHFFNDKLNNTNQQNIPHNYSLPNPEPKKSGSRWGPAGQFAGGNDYGNYPQQYNNYNTPQQNPHVMPGFNQQPQGYISNNNPSGSHYYNMNPTNYMTTSNLPNYINPSPSQQQGKSGDSRKSSYDKMETENTKSIDYKDIHSRLQGKASRQYTNPEEIPVGMMADMIRHQSKRLKEKNGNIKPYTALDPEMTPQVIPQTVKVTDSVKTKIDLFYKFINDERELDKIAKSKKNTDVDLEIYKSKAQERKKDGEKKAVGTAEYQQELIQSELGVRSDGRSIGGTPAGEERRGLGGNSQDIYSQFRKQRSQTYHVSAEERAVNRDMPELCYVCRMPGHVARDCKFGLN